LSPLHAPCCCINIFMTLDVEGAGKVIIKHSARAKRMRITVEPGSVSVSVPSGVPFAQAITFVREHEDWIRTHLARMELREEACRNLLTDLPPIADPEEAREKIAYRFKLLAMETGFAYTRLTIRNQKTRWGSCTFSNAINLNIQLSRLPERLMDYVILHELVHTRIKGHGRDFWCELDKYAGNAKALRRELKKYMLKHM
jgi:predicted metal-dependent hydrolase